MRQITSKDFMKRDDIRGIYPECLNGKIAEFVGRAVCRLLMTRRKIKRPIIAVGYDCRHGNLEIAEGLNIGIRHEGGICQDLSLVSTEHVYYVCGTDEEFYSAGAMVTASHNPKEYNGIKFVHSGCIPFSSEDLEYIAKVTDELIDATMKETGSIFSTFDFEEYATYMVNLAGLDKREDRQDEAFTAVVLGGNGMGGTAFGPIAEQLKTKGFKAIMLETEPDGEFPQGVPNPLKPQFMERLSAKVKEYNADLGIGFDGDADRAGFVDGDGCEIIPSHVFALIAEEKLKNSPKDSVIMRNICCSHLLKQIFPEEGNVTLVDTPVGHGRIKQLMRSNAYKDRTVFAGEHSGHYFYPEFNYVDSGVLTSLYMLSLAWKMKEDGKSLTGKLKEWRERYAWSGEINFTLPTKEALLKTLLKMFDATKGPGVTRYQCQMNGEGVQCVLPANGDYLPEALPAKDLKMLCDNGESGWWFVLRPSGNEPKLRLNVEAWGNDAVAACDKKRAELEAIIIECGATHE